MSRLLLSRNIEGRTIFQNGACSAKMCYSSGLQLTTLTQPRLELVGRP
eukprot:SAG25_NODE_1204_length_3621_cov_8.932993_4_plen_48_part_00